MSSPKFQAEPLAARKSFTFAAEPNLCFEITQQVLRFIDEQGPIAARDEVELALQEALANAVVHGCGRDTSKSVYCEVTCKAEDVVIVVRDPGPGFDPAKVPDPLSDEGRARESGRGLSLIRSLMDEVEYGRNGAEIRMRKRR